MSSFSFSQNQTLQNRYPQGDTLLNHLRESDKALALSDFKNALQLSPSTARNILSFLEGKGVIDVEHENKSAFPRYVYRINPNYRF
ncbi:hypothetical protein HNW13_017545 [Shewanella sp. BF02_Schw]|uniref:hypothetical protein n=1 Tax=Shewanella sp. BF02_Schw TaxID=394908 RepID=UPI0017830A7C|nr:hypothetical protein [Shewanella sp. BF02_Schw]MBO1897544.1 hypothetical protein [Shewanella sp. BF02_Schw]